MVARAGGTFRLLLTNPLGGHVQEQENNFFNWPKILFRGLPQNIRADAGPPGFREKIVRAFDEPIIAFGYSALREVSETTQH